ncbi:hypothetical protein Lfu02_49330 [Longispora fulva]|uniref:Nitroreductase n=1 Tax=Longispora fulva TaxID=619741 RepID=A0A8J7GIU6_9ACTN|nr:nitroreductase family protein [Longispora fulva]MBG6138310.1 nitroreductase [Longispora fulva]GIG60561.1 hypothetical protein Lfu02_49330 [Longispora fulva]
MEYTEVIRRRRMVRQFSDRELSSEAIEKILASALRAPSAGFAQGWAFLVLTEAADRARFWRFAPNQATHMPGSCAAPLIIVPLANEAIYIEHYRNKGSNLTAENWPAPYWFIDTGMATLLMLLTAVDEGLDGLLFWLVPPAERIKEGYPTAEHLDEFRAEFGVPAEYTPVGGVAIGYRSEDLAPQRPGLAEARRGLGEVVHRGHWGG